MRLIIFMLLMMSTITVWAGVGQIVQIEGKVNVIRNSTEYLPEIGFELEEGDSILTGTRSKTQLKFKDDTIINLGRNSEFEVNSYLFEESTSKFDTKLNAKGGFFRAVTGKIGKVAPKKFQLKAKTATMGIRGTVFSAQISANGEQLFCLGGAISVMSEDTEVIVNAGQKTVVVYGEPPTTPVAFTPEEVLYIESETLFQFETIDQETYQPEAQRARQQLASNQQSDSLYALSDEELRRALITSEEFRNIFGFDTEELQNALMEFDPDVINLDDIQKLVNKHNFDPPKTDLSKRELTNAEKRASVGLDESGNIDSSNGETVYSQNGISEATVTGAGASATYRGPLSITALGSSDTVQLFGESSEIPEDGTTFTPSSYVGSERTLSDSDFYDSTGYSYTRWGSWTDTSSSSVAPDFIYLDQSLVHFWVIGERSENLPDANEIVSGTSYAYYSGYLEGVKVGESSNIQMSGPISLTMNLSSEKITEGSLSLYESGLTTAWITASLAEANIYTSSGYYEFIATIEDDDISSGTLLASLYGSSSTEIGGGWTITKTDGEKAQGSFISQQLGTNSATYDVALVAGTSLTTSGTIDEDATANVSGTTITDSSNTYSKNLSGSDVYYYTPSEQEYSTWGEWTTTDGDEFLSGLTDGDLSIHHFVTGDETASIPSSGSATYSGNVAGNIAGSFERLSGSIALSANFASSEISGNMDINKYDGTDWASVTLNTVSISNGATEDFNFGNTKISGVTSDSNNFVKGQFYGPNAEEVGGTWRLKNGTETGVGRFIGKQ